jgi:cysteinyl-tRNA synthetase
MALKLYNSLSRDTEEFIPLHSGEVGLYTCGPTVYNYPHIGNYRAYIFGDILKRYLRYSGYNVKHIMNITDIDDKTIRDSIAQSKTLEEFTKFYTEEFYKDRDALNIIPADKYPKATDYVKEMLELTEKLIENNYAYITEDGSVYFSIEKDAQYGKLSHFTLADLKENAKGRMKKDEYDKDSVQDFALWKAWDKSDGDVYWNPSEILGKDTKIAKGRPGWHIECSAMSIKELGESFDIHTGGIDNMFPHHENEIAQSECATDKSFVKYWMHNEHLMVDGTKMSKSAGNFYTLRDIIEKGINPIAFRYWLYTGHYRTKVNFTLDTVAGSNTALKRLYEAFLALGNDNGEVSEEYKQKLKEVMDEDLNTSQAIAVLWELVHDTTISNPNKRATLLDFDKVFGFGLENLKEEIIPIEILELSIKREEAKNIKDWDTSDKIRAEILSLGYKTEDTPSGPKISKI